MLPEASVLERGIGADFAGAEKERAPGAEMRRRAALMNFILVYLINTIVKSRSFRQMLLLMVELTCVLQDLCKNVKRGAFHAFEQVPL